MGPEMVIAAPASTAISSARTYAPAARVALRGGTLKDAWDAVAGRMRPQVRRLRHLRALPAVQRGPRLRRGAGHRHPANLDRRARRGDVGGAAGMTAPFSRRMTDALRPQTFPYSTPPGLTAPEPRHKVVIVGAGPVGLAVALDLVRHGVARSVLDDNDVVSVGSGRSAGRKRTLEIFDRLGVGRGGGRQGRDLAGRAHLSRRETEVFSFDLLPEARAEDARLRQPAAVSTSSNCWCEGAAPSPADRPAVQEPGRCVLSTAGDQCSGR